jgi:hypothetical protein
VILQDAAPLKIGLLLDATIVPRWQSVLIGELLQASWCRVELAAVFPAPNFRAPSAGKGLHELGRAGTALVRWYLAWEERWTRPADDPLVPCDIAEQLQRIPQLALHLAGAAADSLPADDLARVRDAQLDVLLHLGGELPHGLLLRAARYGVWSLHHGDDMGDGGQAVEGFREVWNREPVSTIVVRALTGPDKAAVLCRTAIPTLLGSVARHRRATHSLGARLLLRQLQELHNRGPAAYFHRVREASAPQTFDTRPLAGLPSNARFAWSLLPHWWAKLNRRIEARTTHRQWILLYAFGKAPICELHRFRALQPPPGRFWADPFVLLEDGTHYVFFEELEYEVGRGHICVLRIGRDGSVSAAERILERPYHVSYPFLLRWRGELYMIPETGDQGTLEVYRCTRFPDRWEFHGYLMRGLPLYDATLYESSGRWWLWATASRALCDVELHLFSAETPLSDNWTPHPANPVVSDVRRARPAGGLFVHNGRLYRPAQDSSRYYGYGVRVQEIVALTQQEYREREAASILPERDPRIAGVHHLSFGGDLTVIDAQVRRRRLPTWR